MVYREKSEPTTRLLPFPDTSAEAYDMFDAGALPPPSWTPPRGGAAFEQRPNDSPHARLTNVLVRNLSLYPRDSIIRIDYDGYPNGEIAFSHKGPYHTEVQTNDTVRSLVARALLPDVDHEDLDGEPSAWAWMEHFGPGDEHVFSALGWTAQRGRRMLVTLTGPMPQRRSTTEDDEYRRLQRALRDVDRAEDQLRLTPTQRRQRLRQILDAADGMADAGEVPFLALLRMFHVVNEAQIIPVFEAATQHATRWYGANHTETLAVRGWHALYLEQEDDLNGFIRIAEEVCERLLLRPAHPCHIHLLTRLSVALAARGRPKSKAIAQTVLPHAQRVFGNDCGFVSELQYVVL